MCVVWMTMFTQGERLMARVLCICRPSELYPVDRDVHYMAGETSKGSCIKGSIEKTLARIALAASKLSCCTTARY